MGEGGQGWEREGRDRRGRAGVGEGGQGWEREGRSWRGSAVLGSGEELGLAAPCSSGAPGSPRHPTLLPTVASLSPAVPTAAGTRHCL